MSASDLTPTLKDDLQQPSEGLKASGFVTQKELKKITRVMRTSVLGPTAVYYAGVTAPAIAAGMATVVGAALNRAGWIDYWVLLTSGIVASMAGISWYLIFMRLSYRHSFGRSTELETKTEFEADELGLFWARGDVKTRISWHGIGNIHVHGGFIQIEVTDAGDVVLPKSWFPSRKDMQDFGESLKTLWHAQAKKSAD